MELRPQAYQVLRHLALNIGRLVGKDELLAAVWPGLVVTDDSLVQAVGDVRRALGEAGHRLLKTVPRRGYMLVAAAVGPVPAAFAAADPPVRLQRLRRRWAVLLGALLLAAIAATHWPWPASGDPAIGTRPSIAVLAFRDP